jgi:hypothetical protein
MLPQAVCSMTVCENAAAGVNCMWASSYDGDLTSWVIDERCVCIIVVSTAFCHVLMISVRLDYKHLGSSFKTESSNQQSGTSAGLAHSIQQVSENHTDDPAYMKQ